jgi:hypothetical protein
MSDTRHSVEAEEPQPDPPLASAEAKLVAQLSSEQVAAIDRTLLAQATHQWRKVAFVVGSAMSKLPDRIHGIPDIYYAQRVRELVARGALVSQGNLRYMRFSEVRLPKSGVLESEA